MSAKQVVIEVEHASVRFNMANQQVNNLKEYLIKMLKKELMFQEFFALKDINLQIRKEKHGELSERMVLANLLC